MESLPEADLLPMRGCIATVLIGTSIQRARGLTRWTILPAIEAYRDTQDSKFCAVIPPEKYGVQRDGV